MNEGRVLPSEKLTLSAAHPNRPQVELQLDQPAEVGRIVRVTVYDKWLFQRSNPGAFNRVFSAFAGFGEPVVPDPVRDAHSEIGDGSNGVLLSFLVEAVGEVPKYRERKYRRWAFGPPSDVVTCKPAQTLVAIAVGLRDEHNEIAYGPTIFLPRAAVRPLRHVVFVVSDPSSYEIIYSNEWRHGDFIKKNRKGTPVLVDAKAADVALPTLVGGDGEGTGAPAPAGRAQPPEDITGKYEAFVAKGYRMGETFPGLMVQINTAGNAIAGWWAPPPARVTGHGHHSIAQPALSQPLQAGEFGVLLGHFEDGAYDVKWGLSAKSVDPTPLGVGLAAAFPNARAGTGRLEILSHQRLKLTLHRGNDHTVLFLEMTEPTPRWSNATLKQVVRRAAQNSLTAKTVLTARQERPIPLAFWRVLQKDLLPTGILGRLIIEHENLSKGAGGARDRQRVRGQMSDYLLGLASVPAYADDVVAHFTLFASAMELQIQGQEKSVYDWLRGIVDDYLSGLIQRSPSMHPREILGRLEQGFVAAGVAPKHHFVYSVEFFSLGAGAGAGASVGAYGFDAHVRRTRVSSSSGRKAADVDDVDAWDLLPKGRKEFYGLFGDIGIGLGAKLKVAGASDMLSVVKFPTFQDISPEAFSKAKFYVITAAGLKGSFALLDATTASSAVVVMTVHSRNPNGPSVRLVAGVDQWMVAPDPTRPNTQVIRNPKDLLSPSATIASLSLGGGWMQETKPSPPTHPDEKTPPEHTMTAPDQPEGRAHRSLAAYFRKNSATLEGANLSALEEGLAVERSLFVSGGGRASIAGHASPEGPDNMMLSQRRADHVEQVIKESFGKRLAVSTYALGYGDRAARNEGLIRPEELPPLPAARDQWQKYREQSQGIAVHYRVVMIWVNGVLAVETRATKAVLGT